jgi:hypothetical protein
VEKVLPVYKQMHARVNRQVDPSFRASLRLGPDGHFPEPRNMAYTTYDEKTGDCCIVVSNKLCRGDAARIEAVMAHEFAHALMMCSGVPHGERDADHCAEVVFGKPISYDSTLVQTTRKGIRPRPRHLGL